MSLDLENGDEEMAEATPAERRAAARKRATEARQPSVKKSTTKKSSSSATDKSRLEGELTGRLNRALDRIAKALEARDDDELADTIREDSEAISQGFISLTRSIPLLRSPLVMLLNLLEPALAFGRVGRILYRRWVARSQRIAAERQAAQQEGSPSLVATQ